MFASHANEVSSSRLQKLYAKLAYGTTLSIWINTFSEVINIDHKFCSLLFFDSLKCSIMHIQSL
jgi:hypothetical protein